MHLNINTRKIFLSSFKSMFHLFRNVQNKDIRIHCIPRKSLQQNQSAWKREISKFVKSLPMNGSPKYLFKTPWCSKQS